MNVLRKLVYFALATIFLGVGAAEAQEPTKIPRIGYISGAGNLANQGPYVEACGKDYAISVILKRKIL